MSLSNRSLLVSIRISIFEVNRKDRGGEKILADAHNSDSPSEFKARKNIISGDSLKKLRAIGERMRTLVESVSLPWLSSVRIMPITGYTGLVQKFEELKRLFDAEVEVFANAYPALVADARQRLNGAFDERQYPSDIRSKFGCRLEVQPFAGADDFRANLLEEDAEILRQEIRSQEQSRISATVNDVFDRAVEYVQNCADILGRTEKGSRIHADLFLGVGQFCNLLGSLNFYNDSKLSLLLAEMQAVISSIDLDQCKQSPQFKADSAKQVAGILAKFNL